MTMMMTTTMMMMTMVTTMTTTMVMMTSEGVALRNLNSTNTGQVAATNAQTPLRNPTWALPMQAACISS
jgi:hypothetical protein